ncbi:KdsC family phosphatase [Orrella marina]|uniref:3-deoxy-D-manno-octulosonate 8-phosphate phosphatase KdsC n=1 Tax=Orrella marina TaxID=2163011 RepID=A0A2R4XL26_9BURK|nr:HAD hydrolase family protein [Orrella marina]AWB34502.1 phenylphosphate carboxylase subunit delta [Orrella marina]
MTEQVSHPAEALILARAPASVIQRAASVRLMVFDVDGILTDGSLWYSEQGEMLKRFNVLDGHGLKMLATSGVKVALITARQGPIVAMRAAELGIGDVTQGARDKGLALTTLASQHEIALEHVGYMGDDIIDMPALQRAGFAVTVPNAPAYVAQGAHWTTQVPGGHGAVRECCDLILAAQGRLGAQFRPDRVIPGGVTQ